MTTMGWEITLLDARTTNGTPVAAGVSWVGGGALLSVYGTWNGATVQISYSPDGGTTFIDTDGGTFTANSTLLMTFPNGRVKATIANAGGSTSLSCKLQRA